MAAPQKELFIHGRASFDDAEWHAFEQAAPPGRMSLASGSKRPGGETKLFRDGDYPVLRGTALILDDRSANLWTTGYVPQLDTYIGPETAKPFVHHGPAQQKQNAQNRASLNGHHDADKNKL